MKFLIGATSNWGYGKEVVEKYPCLKDFGFTVETIERTPPYFVERSYIEIKDLSDLLRLINVLEDKVIISNGDEGYELEIYDDYRE